MIYALIPHTVNVKDILTGSNFSTECCREPEDWGGYLGIDKTLFNDVWKKCGDGTSNSDFPLVDIIVYKFWYQKAVGMKVHHPLNLVSFLKSDAEGELNSKFGWQKFQHKHHESRFTRFMKIIGYQIDLDLKNDERTSLV